MNTAIPASWDLIEDQLLEVLITEISISDIAKIYKRTESEINDRITKLGIINKIIFEANNCIYKPFSKTEVLVDSLIEKYSSDKDSELEIITDIVSDFVIDVTNKVKNKNKNK
jgi:hypothetical protein